MGTLARLAIAAGVAVREDSAPAVSPSPTPAGVMPPYRGAGGAVTPREALALDSVYRAFSILQTAAMQLTVDVYRAGSVLSPRPSLANRPNVAPGEHAGGFWADTVASLAAQGNAYWRKRRGADGAVISLEQLHPLEVLPYRDKRGTLRYSHRGTDYTTRDVAHLKLLRVPGSLTGLGPIQAAQLGLRGQLDVHGYGAKWFTDSGVPNGVLSTDQSLTAAQAAEWKAQWKASMSGHDTAVLGSGLDYKALYLRPSEVQWLESQAFGVTSIARLFGIPSRQMLAAIEGSSTTYANAEQEDISFVRYTLMQYLREVELVLTDCLPRGQEARFNVDALLRTDTKTRYESHAIGINAGFLSTAEVRAIEGIAGPAPTPAPATQETPTHA